MLTQLITWRLLVPPDSQQAEEIQASFQAGATAVNCEVLQCLQALEDSEIYQVRRSAGEIAALKICDPAPLLRVAGCSTVRQQFSAA